MIFLVFFTYGLHRRDGVSKNPRPIPSRPLKLRLNAFLPFAGEGRREALELIRHTFAREFGVVSCLEIGPRYLHSTGQLQKGGANNGVFLILSADELKDIPLSDWRAPSLGALAKAQAEGDLKVLSERGRRVVHLHLPDNSGATLRQVGEVVQKVARSL